MPGTGGGGNCQRRTPPRRPAGATGRGEEVLVLDVSEWEQEEVLGFVGADERSHLVSKCPNPKIDDGMVSLKSDNVMDFKPRTPKKSSGITW